MQCFTCENQWGQRPLTYSSRFCDNPTTEPTTPTHRESAIQEQPTAVVDVPPEAEAGSSRPKLVRRNTIEWKTPGRSKSDTKGEAMSQSFHFMLIVLDGTKRTLIEL